MEIKMSRFDNSPWGFRVHGGIDFGAPLRIQKVNLRSLGEAAGLQAGDIIFSVDGQDISLLKHKEAQEAIKTAGHNFVLTVGRDGETISIPKPVQPQQIPAIPPQALTPPQQWKPEVNPVGQVPSKPTQPGQTFTKTSLEANIPEDSHWDVKHNQAAKGFNSSPAKTNGISNNASQPPGPPPMAVNPPHHQVNLGPQNLGPQKLGPNLPTKQYNSPKHMYSDEAIQEIMAQQAEVLAGGVKGINFKQYEQPQKEVPANSEVLKALLEYENHGQGIAGLPEFQEDRRNQVHGFKAVSAPVTKIMPEGGQAQPSGPPLNTCAQCDQLITGVFCKVQGKPLHGECFKCFACSTSLKNVGYFSVSDKLYCETHARAAKASENVSQRIPMNTQQQQQQPTQPAAAARQQQQPTQQDWSKILNTNMTGSSTNAEDFTKQFMSEMFGNNGAGLTQQQPPPQENRNVQQVNNGRAQQQPIQERQNQAPPPVIPQIANNQNAQGSI